MATTDESMFWELIDELQLDDPRVEEGTIMGGRCARVAGEFLGLVDFKGSGLVVKLPRTRVQELIDEGVGQPFVLGRQGLQGMGLDPTTRSAPLADPAARGVAFVAPN